MSKDIVSYLILGFAFCGITEFASDAQEVPLQTQIVQSTYLIENPKSNGTVFILRMKEAKDDSDDSVNVLVTANHVLDRIEDAKASLILRTKGNDGSWEANVLRLKIRDGKDPLWVRHPKEDVAVLVLDSSLSVAALPGSVLACEADWKRQHLQPGEAVRCVGFPHAAVFRPNPAAFATTRIGCIASYPLTPYPTVTRFLVDYNTFEGDSGGPVYWMNTSKPDEFKIIGLVHGQHFLDETYRTKYEQGTIKKRLGLAIIVHSQAIQETIDLALQ